MEKIFAFPMVFAGLLFCRKDESRGEILTTTILIVLWGSCADAVGMVLYEDGGWCNGKCVGRPTKEWMDRKRRSSNDQPREVFA